MTAHELFVALHEAQQSGNLVIATTILADDAARAKLNTKNSGERSLTTVPTSLVFAFHFVAQPFFAAPKYSAAETETATVSQPTETEVAFLQAYMRLAGEELSHSAKYDPAVQEADRAVINTWNLTQASRDSETVAVAEKTLEQQRYV